MSRITIAPIGTCRISTPLKHGAARFPIKLDYQRIYGFVHTTTEVIQQLRFRKGEVTFPPELVPILFRPGVSCDDALPEKPADLTVVEVSSTKVYMLGDVAIQCNYLHQYFPDFFASPARVRAYVELTSRDNRNAVKSFLSRDPVYKLYRPKDREILANLSTRIQTFEEVAADLETIAGMVGKDRLLLVTHVNVATAEGSLIASRDKLIRWMKLASSELGIECFDPTALMLEFGQERAMESGGLDSTHYTDAFSDAWFSAVQRDYILPHAARIGVDAGDMVASESSVLSESIAIALQYDVVEGARLLFAALKEHPEDVQLQLLHGQLLERLGDYDGASKVLTPHVGRPGLSHEMRQALMRVFIETCDWQRALDLASQMIGDEYQSAEIFGIAGRAADQLDRPEESVRYRKLAFRLDPSAPDTVTPVLDQYLATGERDLYEAWLAEVLEAFDRRSDAALACGLAEWAMLRREGEALAGAVTLVARKDPGLVPALIEEALRTGMAASLTIAAETLVATPGLAENSTKPLQRLAESWVATAQELTDAGRTREAHEFAAAALAIQPNLRIARSMRRTVVDALWQALRDTQDEHAIVELCERAGEVIYERRAIAQLFGRALASIGRMADAEEVSRKMYLAAPDDVDAMASYAHLAGLNGSFRVALELYGELSKIDGESTRRFRNRINAFMAAAGSKGIRHIRALVAEQQFEEAIATLRVLERYGSLSGQKLTSESARILSALRMHLRQLDEEEARPRELLETIDLMLSLAPDDPRMLRRAALENMKAEEFVRAMELWRRVEAVSPDMKSANSIQRCEILADRQARKKARSRPNSVPLAA